MVVRGLTPEQSLLVYVVLQSLDVAKETIELVHTKPTETHELPYRIPADTPRYHFFIFKHSHQGQRQEALGQYSLTLQVGAKWWANAERQYHVLCLSRIIYRYQVPSFNSLFFNRRKGASCHNTEIPIVMRKFPPCAHNRTHAL